MDLKSPIGYLKAKTRIKVGEVARRNKRILPTVISGKIVYIKISDVKLLEDTRKTAQVVDSKYRSAEDKGEDEPVYLSHKALSFAVNVINVKGMADGLRETEDAATEAENLFEYKLRFEEHRRKLFNTFYYRLGANLQLIANGDLLYRGFAVAGNLVYRLLGGSQHSLNAILELSHSIYSAIKIKDRHSSGHYHAAECSLEYSLFITKRLSLRIGGGYHYQQPKNFQIISRTDPNNLDFSNFHYYGGLGYEF